MQTLPKSHKYKINHFIRSNPLQSRTPSFRIMQNASSHVTDPKPYTGEATASADHTGNNYHMRKPVYNTSVNKRQPILKIAHPGKLMGKVKSVNKINNTSKAVRSMTPHSDWYMGRTPVFLTSNHNAISKPISRKVMQIKCNPTISTGSYKSRRERYLKSNSTLLKGSEIVRCGPTQNPLRISDIDPEDFFAYNR